MATAIDVVKQSRTPLYLAKGNEGFTLKREEIKAAENVRLITHFASWLSAVTSIKINADTLPEDLIDGVALCMVASKIPNSGVSKWHTIPSGMAKLDAFKAKENMAQFQSACKKLSLPCVFGTQELEQGNLGQIATTLVFLAHTATVHGVMVKEMDPELRTRVESVIVESMNSIETAAPAAADVTTSWWQAILIKFGLGSWIAKLDPAALKAYFAQLQQLIKDKQLEAQTKLEESRTHLSGRFTAQIDEVKSKVDAQINDVKAQVQAVKTSLGEKRASAEKLVLEKAASFKAAIPDSVKEKLPESLKSKLVA